MPEFTHQEPSPRPPLRDRADSSGLSGWSCVPAVADVAAHHEALSLGARLLKPADDIESAEGFQLCADHPCRPFCLRWGVCHRWGCRRDRRLAGVARASEVRRAGCYRRVMTPQELEGLAYLRRARDLIDREY